MREILLCRLWKSDQVIDPDRCVRVTYEQTTVSHDGYCSDLGEKETETIEQYYPLAKDQSQ